MTSLITEKEWDVLPPSILPKRTSVKQSLEHSSIVHLSIASIHVREDQKQLPWTRMWQAIVHVPRIHNSLKYTRRLMNRWESLISICRSRSGSERRIIGAVPSKTLKWICPILNKDMLRIHITPTRQSCHICVPIQCHYCSYPSTKRSDGFDMLKLWNGIETSSYFAHDIKCLTEERHRCWTGYSESYKNIVRTQIIPNMIKRNCCALDTSLRQYYSYT